ncbi:hypothetical protein BKA63DRAFT_515169 [Paraphoma chrysanthemicola]|nr:hypothetical protein BKA63DRAFT_515169 [Paraphoma chrysanthemicola]
MAAIDFARLRNQTMADGQDSEVTVNTRALIDKVLARYSSEHTTLRELIQNAADAKADTVTIKFETDPSLTVPTPHGVDESVLLKHIIQNHTMKRLAVTNNGQPFTAADWSRLKSIADGNPDETKIGAFGVGFYSVFSDCDEPFVVSGDKTMAFYWKGNTLSTKMAAVPAEHPNTNTTFFLDYRQANQASPSFNPSKLPNLPTLCQFLATSLTFVGLESIELHVDDYVVASFSKKISPPDEIRLPAGLKTDTEGGLMRVSRVTRQHSQIDAEWLNAIASAQNPPKRAANPLQQEVRNAGNSLKSFFSKFSTPAQPPPSKTIKAQAPERNSAVDGDIAGESTGTIFLQVCTIEVATKVSRNFAAEIERATKKPPPKATKIALLTSPYQDRSVSPSIGSGKTAQLADKIFSEVLPTKTGRIFIGFPTAQTTGYLAHVSAPSLIPTVERENVDMNARYISTWNIELLRVAGLGCRITYMAEMSAIQARVGTEPVDALVPRAIHVFQQYTANPSHPSSALGEKIEEAFWNCSKERSIDILSTKGVMASKRVRMPAETLSFLGEVPMVPQELANGAVTFMLNLHNRGFISELTMQDIRDGLESRALTEDELSEFLKWCGSKLESGELDIGGSRGLFELTVANIEVDPERNSGRILALGDINTYVNPARITPNLPLPPDTVPFAFTKSMPVKQLQMFGWIELSMVRWLRHMTTQPQLDHFTTSESLASSVLSLASKCWEQLDGSSKETVVKILTPHAVMPTKMGMRRPTDSYFPTVKLFDDLPIVKTFVGSREKFLLALGVRKTIDLPVVFDRMRNRDAQDAAKVSWNHVDLLRYFASVIDEIPKKDLDRLRDTPFLPGEGVSVPPGQLFKASDLYAPDQAILSLGFTQVKLPFEFKSGQREGVLLLRLGLRQWPDSIAIANILHKAGRSADLQLYKKAMEYFLGNYYGNGYAAEVQQFANLTIPILPTEQAPFPALVGPFQCFTNESAACLGFAILRSDLRPHADKFGVQRDPSIAPCVQYLLNTPPRSKIDAEMQFAYLASRASEFEQNKALIGRISTSNVVPVFRKYYLDPGCKGFEDRTIQQTGKSEMRLHHHDPPEHVFVGRDQEYRGILDYVHYGAEATNFLLMVGAKHEPSTHDLALLLSKNPARFLNTIGQDKYLDLLRKLSEYAENLWKDKELVKALVASRALLGYRDIKDDTKTSQAKEEDYDDLDEPIMHREWSLNQVNDVVIIDNVNYLQKFRDFLIAAPQEEVLEEFYARFGVKKVSDLVKTEQRIGNPLRDQISAQALRKDIMERVRLFLHEYERDATSSKAIKHDAKWLGSNLIVQSVSDISIRYSLEQRNVATSSRKTAVIVKERGRGYVLSITPKYDLYEVSTELIRLLISRPKRNDAFGLERILTEPLRRLQQKGINVERILRKQEHEARIAKQQELEREYEDRQRAAEQAKSALVTNESKENTAPPATPEKANQMPGSFGSPDTGLEVAENNRPPADKSLINNWAKKLGFKTEPTPRTGTDGPQISRDVQATKSNIQNAIKDCRPTGMQNINTKHHQDPTELDRGGYCNGEQWENLHKAFSVPFAGRHVDVYYGVGESSPLGDLQVHLAAFLPLILGLTSILTVDPAAVNIFLDRKSNTVAFNLNGSLFFNLAWFMALHSEGWGTRQGRLRALDSWFCTYCHELAHNLVGDHNARHSWYQQQIIIEYSQQYRAALERYTQGLLTE